MVLALAKTSLARARKSRASERSLLISGIATQPPVAAVDRIYTHCRHKKSLDVFIQPCFQHSDQNAIPGRRVLAEGDESQGDAVSLQPVARLIEARPPQTLAEKRK